jgi:hypothetical protein
VADYFLVLEEELFEGQMRPALAAAWRWRSFEPCRPLCASLQPQVTDFAARYHTGEGEPLVAEVVRGLPFHRDFWRALVGELLFYAAVEIPEFQTCPDTLCCLLAPGQGQDQSPIRQAHFGTSELTFGLAVYRPDHCGYNNRADVCRLADYLATVDPDRWHPDDLASLPGLAGDEEWAEELEIARDWFPPLRDLYRQAAEKSRIIVHEWL